MRNQDKNTPITQTPTRRSRRIRSEPFSCLILAMWSWSFGLGAVFAG